MPKLQRNVERDARNEAMLRQAGWTLIVVWQHDDLVDPTDRIESVVRASL